MRKQLIGWRNGLVQKANVGKFGGAVGNVEMASTPTADLSSADRTSAAQLKGAIVETWEQAGDTSMLMWLEMLEEKHVEMYQNGAFLLSQVLERYPEGHPTPTAAKAAREALRVLKGRNLPVDGDNPRVVDNFVGELTQASRACGTIKDGALSPEAMAEAITDSIPYKIEREFKEAWERLEEAYKEAGRSPPSKKSVDDVMRAAKDIYQARCTRCSRG